MADIWMDVDTALSEVPVNVLPLIDNGDFKTIEDAVAYNAAGMDLRWNFVTTAGSFTSTPVAPTSGGVHDWTHQGDGIYTIEIPAASGGGAEIYNDTEGFGWFSGVATGVLPWRGPIIGFRAAALNDLHIDDGYVDGSGSDKVNIVKAMEMMVAFISGKVSVSSAAGVSTYTYKKHDGSTSSFTALATEANGTRATTGDVTP